MFHQAKELNITGVQLMGPQLRSPCFAMSMSLSWEKWVSRCGVSTDATNGEKHASFICKIIRVLVVSNHLTPSHFSYIIWLVGFYESYLLSTSRVLPCAQSYEVDKMQNTQYSVHFISSAMISWLLMHYYVAIIVTVHVLLFHEFCWLGCSVVVQEEELRGGRRGRAAEGAEEPRQEALGQEEGWAAGG